jgi:HTH-type transcriptional regulator/antitoxin HigA
MGTALANPVEMIRLGAPHLIQSEGELAEYTELGSETTVSLVMSGRRQLTREHIARLSERFHVSPAVFFD